MPPFLFFLSWSRIWHRNPVKYMELSNFFVHFLFNLALSRVHWIIRRGRYLWWIYDVQRVIGCSLLQVRASGLDLVFEFISFSIFFHLLLFMLCSCHISSSTILLVSILCISSFSKFRQIGLPDFHFFPYL